MSNQKDGKNQQTGHDQESDRNSTPVPSIDEPANGERSNSQFSGPSPIGQKVFDRLNAQIQRERSGIEPDLAQKYLEQIGTLVRTWRIKRDYTRIDLARKLKLDVDQLLCIERGIGLQEDISENQLLTLQSFLGEDELDKKLNQTIEIYLAWLRKL